VPDHVAETNSPHSPNVSAAKEAENQKKKKKKKTLRKKEGKKGSHESANDQLLSFTPTPSAFGDTGEVERKEKNSVKKGEESDRPPTISIRVSLSPARRRYRGRGGLRKKKKGKEE